LRNDLQAGSFAEDEISKFKSCFELFDRDKNGLMKIEDVAFALRSQGVLITDRDLSILIKR
jgi:Ca2+-binding EF-hand superfamily protein